MPKVKPVLKPLTQKESKFVEYVLEGNSYKDAYIKAYTPKVSDDKKIYRASQRVRQRESVKHALQEGKAKVNIESILWNRDKSIETLLTVLYKAKEQMELKGISKSLSDTMLGSIRELNSIVGIHYKDYKKYEIDIAKLEIERLNYELNKKTKLADPNAMEELEDDGFIDAMKSEISNIWNKQ